MTIKYRMHHATRSRFAFWLQYRMASLYGRAPLLQGLQPNPLLVRQAG